MNFFKKIITLIITCGLFLAIDVSMAGEIRVAVASNFTETIKALSRQFEDKTGHKVTLIFGATGRHYAQIKNGAPFDVFFAADSKRPKLLEDEGLAIADSRFTYALGKLVLWSPKENFIDSKAKVLDQANFYHLAIANPKLAPYGKAAQEFLQTHLLWDTLMTNEQHKPKIVRGENIGQTFQFVKSGNAELGFVALSQVKHLIRDETGSLWVVPTSLYSPIKQQAVLLKKNSSANEFLSFVKSDEAQNIIKSFGYGVIDNRKHSDDN